MNEVQPPGDGVHYTKAFDKTIVEMLFSDDHGMYYIQVVNAEDRKVLVLPGMTEDKEKMLDRAKRIIL